MPNFIRTSTNSSASSSSSAPFMKAICKERFPKSYRHPTLDETLTRSRTRAECRSLARCRRHGVSVPIVLGVDLKKAVKNGSRNGNNEDKGNNVNAKKESACLFLEHVEGCTLRSFLNLESGNGDNKDVKDDNSSNDEPATKKIKTGEGSSAPQKRITTRMDKYAKKAAYVAGVTIGTMHNANIIHGDLTTSNILLRNPNPTDEEWKPDIVLIDFGLSSTAANTKKMSCHEERAVDLYVLERAFITTHVDSETLVDEVMRGYKAACQASDSVFVRLAQVRSRGRKRECFG